VLIAERPLCGNEKDVYLGHWIDNQEMPKSNEPYHFVRTNEFPTEIIARAAKCTWQFSC
jgi:hypothetical protein